MSRVTEPVEKISAATVDTAARLSRLSVGSAERVIALQLDFARATLATATKTAREAAAVKDVSEFLALRTRSAEAAFERIAGFSRNFYEVVSDAQSELSRLAEDRVSAFQQTIDLATKNAPAGSEVAVQAIKSSLAASTAAFDTFSKAARHAASYADAGIKSASKRRK